MTTKTVRPRSRIEECHRQNSPVLRCFTLSLVASGLSLAVLCAQAAVAQTNIPKIAAATCAVMSGERKADGQTLQYLLLLDQDLGDANPVALALDQEVIKGECNRISISQILIEQQQILKCLPIGLSFTGHHGAGGSSYLWNVGLSYSSLGT